MAAYPDTGVAVARAKAARYPSHGWGRLAEDPGAPIGANGPAFREIAERIARRADADARAAARPATDTPGEGFESPDAAPLQVPEKRDGC